MPDGKEDEETSEENPDDVTKEHNDDGYRMDVDVDGTVADRHRTRSARRLALREAMVGGDWRNPWIRCHAAAALRRCDQGWRCARSLLLVALWKETGRFRHLADERSSRVLSVIIAGIEATQPVNQSIDAPCAATNDRRPSAGRAQIAEGGERIVWRPRDRRQPVRPRPPPRPHARSPRRHIPREYRKDTRLGRHQS